MHLSGNLLLDINKKEKINIAKIMGLQNIFNSEI